jgi:hypothetical protein
MMKHSRKLVVSANFANKKGVIQEEIDDDSTDHTNSDTVMNSKLTTKVTEVYACEEGEDSGPEFEDASKIKAKVVKYMNN